MALTFKGTSLTATPGVSSRYNQSRHKPETKDCVWKHFLVCKVVFAAVACYFILMCAKQLTGR